MSHVVNIKCEITNIEACRRAFEALGAEFEAAETYRWFGRSVGDYPLPAGFTEADLGRCEYKASWDGIDYDVGVARNAATGHYTLLFDFWGPGKGLLEKLGGQQGEAFLQRYAAETQKLVAEAEGWEWQETVTPTGAIELTLTQF